jgi:hypothetical protein
MVARIIDPDEPIQRSPSHLPVSSVAMTFSEALGGAMRLVKRALVPVLVAALAMPSAAAAQDLRGPVGAARASEPESLESVRLTFEDGRRANPWDVFGHRVAGSGHTQGRARIGDAPAVGSPTVRPRPGGVGGAQVFPAKGQPAAKKWAGQGAASGVRKGLGIALGIALVVGYFLLMAIASDCSGNPQGCSASR